MTGWGIGAILAVPLTLLVLIIMGNFEGTRPVVILMLYTGEAKKEKRQKAAEQAKGVLGKPGFQPVRPKRLSLRIGGDTTIDDRSYVLCSQGKLIAHRNTCCFWHNYNTRCL